MEKLGGDAVRETFMYGEIIGVCVILYLKSAIRSAIPMFVLACSIVQSYTN